MIVDVDEVLTLEEFEVFEVLAKKAIEMARSLGRHDKEKSIAELLENARRETRQVYGGSGYIG